MNILNTRIPRLLLNELYYLCLSMLMWLSVILIIYIFKIYNCYVNSTTHTRAFTNLFLWLACPLTSLPSLRARPRGWVSYRDEPALVTSLPSWWACPRDEPALVIESAIVTSLPSWASLLSSRACHRDRLSLVMMPPSWRTLIRDEPALVSRLPSWHANPRNEPDFVTSLARDDAALVTSLPSWPACPRAVQLQLHWDYGFIVNKKFDENKLFSKNIVLGSQDVNK